MGLYNSPHAGTHVYRNRKKLKNIRKIFNLTYGECFPVFSKFVLPGDVWKLRPNCFIRYMPTLAPILTECNADFRFFFVPLRQVIDNIEQIITGSKEGSLITSELPECKNFIKEYLDFNPQLTGDYCHVHKNSFWAALGIRPTKTYKQTHEGTEYEIQENIGDQKNASDYPAAYWFRAYCKIIWDYYRDENYQSFDGDFELFYKYMVGNSSVNVQVKNQGWSFGTDYQYLQSDTNPYNLVGASDFKLWFANVNKDYFMSALPWIMKGSEPTINSVMHADFTDSVALNNTSYTGYLVGLASGADVNHLVGGGFNAGVNADVVGNKQVLNALNSNKITDGGFSAKDIRDLFAETRVFERLARCGSRYVEYLEANFGIAPRDDTLQRPLYLGGYSQPIVTTEVVQTGGSDTGDVGTLRGHGISSGGNSIRPFVATEFGVVMGIMCVKPKTQYLYQIDRQLTYKKRFDFFNPSFQNLSEQQINNLEFYQPIREPDFTQVDYGNEIRHFKDIERFTFGYQGMYNELRYDNDIICRDMADNLSYWTQAVDPALNVQSPWITADKYKTPPLNGITMSIGFYLQSLLRPFEATNGDFKPMIVDFGMGGEVYRPMIRDPIPALADHN